MLLSERSQSKKVTYCMSPTARHSGKGKTTDRIKRLVVARGPGVVRGELREHVQQAFGD